MYLARPTKKTDVYLILHESAHHPQGMDFEYMAGHLRDDLQKRKFGPALTETGYIRVKDVAAQLRDKGIQEIITDDFATPLETARVIAARGLDVPQVIGDEAFKHQVYREEGIVTDPRIAESDLGYLTRERFEDLYAKSKEDPFIFTRDWYSQASQEEKDKLYNGLVEVWNQAIAKNSGKPFAFVLHVEGIQFFVNELLGRLQDKMSDLHFRRGSYVHAQVFPNRDAIVSF